MSNHQPKLAIAAWCLAFIGLAFTGSAAFGDEAYSMDLNIGAGGYGSGGSPSTKAGILSNVPAYNWYHGCGPTAAASIIGYYDVHGFDNLFTASGWNNVKLTANVRDQISSPAHNAKYDPTPDNESLPLPASTSIADWFGTSVDPLEYGWAYQSKADDALQGYATYRGYQCTSSYEPYSFLSWSDLMHEINAGRPMMFLVDSDGNGGTDHFVPVFGYDDRGTEGKFYGCYTTWGEDETVAWYQFRGMSSSYSWGVGYGTYFHIVPEPSTLILLSAAGLALLIPFWRRK